MGYAVQPSSTFGIEIINGFIGLLAAFVTLYVITILITNFITNQGKEVENKLDECEEICKYHTIPYIPTFMQNWVSSFLV